MSEIIYGKNSFKEAIQQRKIIKAYVLENSEFIQELKNKKINFEIVKRAQLDKLTKSGNHQGIVAEAEEYKLATVDEMIKEKNGFIVILDGLKDPHNLGAIVRTCDCAQVDGIIYKKHNAVKVNDTVAKVASGALEYVKIAEVTNLVNTIKHLKEKGYWVVGTDASADKLYTELKYDFNTALIIGSEGEGISRLVAQECDFMVSLPLKGHVNSLNASVAAGILIYSVINARS